MIIAPKLTHLNSSPQLTGTDAECTNLWSLRTNVYDILSQTTLPPSQHDVIIERLLHIHIAP